MANIFEQLVKTFRIIMDRKHLQDFFRTHLKNADPNAAAAMVLGDLADAAVDAREQRKNRKSLAEPSPFLDLFGEARPLGLSDRPIGPKGRSNICRITDSILYLIYCPAHRKIAVTRNCQNIAFLPYLHLTRDRTWRDFAMDGSFSILTQHDGNEIFKLRKNPPYEMAEIVDVSRFDVSQGLHYNTRLLFYIQLGQPQNENPVPGKKTQTPGQAKFKNIQSRMSQKKEAYVFKCCQQRGFLHWLPIELVSQGRCPDYHFWGPEIVFYTRSIEKFIKGQSNIREFQRNGETLGDPRKMITREELAKIKCEKAMYMSVGLTDNDIDRIYWDFMNHCFPSLYMTIWSFKAYMISYGFGGNCSKAAQLFGAFNVNRNGFMTFHEFLMGLICIEPASAHSDFRLSFVFRYYDTRNAGTLTENDFARLLRDNFPRESPDLIVEKTVEILKPYKREIRAKGGLSWNTFNFIVHDCQIRGTSLLCRSRKNIFVYITQLVAERQMEMQKAHEKAKIGQIIAKRQRNVCQNCRAKCYKMIRYIICLGITGCPLRICSTAMKNLRHVDIHPKKIDPILDVKDPVNKLLFAIHKFNTEKGDVTCPRGLWQDKPEQFYAVFRTLCVNVAHILAAENNKCPAVYGPTVVIGDIHGNLEDLLSLEHSCWAKFVLSPKRFVFLGDYVDRGKWSIECATYILCLKALMPHKVTLLRGNHEVRPIQEKYSFTRECIEKYTERFGIKIWLLLNETFDLFPVACTIDGAFFAAHGGIPYTATKIEELQALPLAIPTPETHFPEVWEIMWSDPILDNQFLEICYALDIDPTEGFVRNTKRGAAFFYAEHGAFKFLKENGLTHIVRAHEVPGPGFSFHFREERCITIFSSSHYCGNLNDAAVLLLDRFENKARVIRIDTSMNSTATDG